MDYNYNFCVKCGSCKAKCPTYEEGQIEGMSARGRLMLLKKYYSGDIGYSDTLKQRIFSCILCGACNSLCPLGINITEAIYNGRKEFRKITKNKGILEFLIRLSFNRTERTMRALRILQNISHIIPVYKIKPLNTLVDMKISLPTSFLREKASLYKASNSKARVAIFAGCTVNFLYPEIGRSLIKSLNALSYDVILPRGEACCGAPLMGLGIEEDTIKIAEKNIKLYKDLNVEAVIGLCPTCVYFIKDYYKKIYGEGIDNALEISQFLVDKLKEKKKIPLASVIYHHPCHSRYSLNIKDEPKKILNLMGINLIEPKNTGCCGFGGTFRVSYKGLSENILKKRIEDYKEANIIITSCPNCILQFRSELKDKPVKHIAELLLEYLKGEENGR